MLTEDEKLNMQPDPLAEYEKLKMQPDRMLLKCVLCIMILAGLALMGAKTDLGALAASAQNEESGAIVEPRQSFDELAGIGLDIVGHRSY